MPTENDATILSSARPAARFIVKQGPQIGIAFPMMGKRVVIGREDGCDIKIHDAESSRQHCEVMWKDNAFVLQDLNSSNGTFLNGTQVTAPMTLKAGDRIGIGQTLLVLELDSEGQGVPVAYDAAPAGPISAPHVPIQPEKKGSKKKWLVGCGCLILLCACVPIVAAGVDLAGIWDFGLRDILSNYQIVW